MWAAGLDDMSFIKTMLRDLKRSIILKLKKKNKMFNQIGGGIPGFFLFGGLDLQN